MSVLKEYIIRNILLYKLYLRFKIYIESKKGISKKMISRYICNSPTIIEIGAHVGSDTVEMSVMWPSAKIYAFEPIKDIYNRLNHKTKNFKNVEIIQAAVSDENSNSKAEMYVSSTSDCSSSLLKPKDHLIYCPEVSFLDKTVPINTIILGDWLLEKNINQIDLIWIDVQGMELNIFKSLGDMIDKVECIYTEVSIKEFYEGSGSYDDIKKYLSDRGFILLADDLEVGQLMGNALFKRNNLV
jgi:FkbM family methyltransferase